MTVGAFGPTGPFRLPLQSLDGGVTWAPIGEGFPSSAIIQSLSVSGDGTVYAGTQNAGTFSYQPLPDRPLPLRARPRPTTQPVRDLF